MKGILILLLLIGRYASAQTSITIEANNCWIYSKEVLTILKDTCDTIEVKYVLYDYNASILKEYSRKVEKKRWDKLRSKISKSASKYECVYSKQNQGYKVDLKGCLSLSLCDYRNKLRKVIFDGLYIPY